MQIKVLVKFGKVESILEKDDCWEVKLNVLPQKGKANKRIIDLIAQQFGVAKNAVIIIQGKKSKNKILEISQ